VVKLWIASGRELDLGKPGHYKTDIIGMAKRDMYTAMVTLLEGFKSDATKTRKEIRQELGIAGQSTDLPPPISVDFFLMLSLDFTFSTPPKLTQEQYSAFIGSPAGICVFLACLDGKVDWNLFVDFLDGKPVTNDTTGDPPPLHSIYSSRWFRAHFSAPSFLESPLAVALKVPCNIFAAAAPAKFTSVTDITSLFLANSNLATLPETLGLHSLLLFSLTTFHPHPLFFAV